MLKKLLCSILALTLSFSLLTGCSSDNSSTSSEDNDSNSSTPDESGKDDTSDDSDEEPYEVNFMYFVAMEGSGQSAVNEAVNELALEELNMTVNMIPITTGTYMSQITLNLSANEPLDIFPVFSTNFAPFIEAQYIVDAYDYTEYVPDIYEVLGEEDAEAANFGGFLAGFGQMKERAFPAGLIARKDIFEELGYSVEDFNVNTDDYSSFDQLSELFADVKAKYPDMMALDGTAALGLLTNSFIDTLGDSFGVLEDYGQTTTVTNWYESEQYKNFALINQEWYDAGYSSQDISVNTDSGEVKMKAGNCFSYFSLIKPNTDVEKQAQTGYDVVVIPTSDKVKSNAGAASLVVSVANASEDKAKAFEFLNWTYTSTEFNDLINWGVEGVNWVKDEDGLAQFPEGIDSTTVTYHNNYGWSYPNQFAGTPWTGNAVDIWDQYAVYNDSALKSQVYGFMVDTSSVATQIGQLNAVKDQYDKDISFGVLSDIESKIQEYNDALYAAGLQDVIDLKQQQIDDWLAAQ